MMLQFRSEPRSISLIVLFRYTNLELWVDDKLVSKTSKSYEVTRTDDFFIKNFLIGWNTRDRLQICNDCEKTQIGSKFKFLWTGGEYGKIGKAKEFWENNPYPAQVSRIELKYRDPGENSFFTYIKEII